MENVDFNNTYIGLTIGPIFKAINYARETGELWGSSYIFSYIIKNIICTLIKSDDSIKSRFIVPYVDDKEIFTTPTEVGLFHDRFIFKSNEGDFEKVSSMVEEVKDCFKKNVFNQLEQIHKEKMCQDLVYEYIDNYLKIYFLEVEVNPNDNIILTVSKYLDALELREHFVDKEEKPYLFEILKNKNVKNGFLSEDAYGEGGKKGGYPSLLNIALAGLKDKSLPMEDNKIVEYLNKNSCRKYNLKKAHEYVALVQADGDSIGKVIEKLEITKDNKFENYKIFSKKLLDYAKKANEIIKGYGGFAIFAGGDDLLFIAPVINEDKNIFTLIDELSNCFNVQFKEDSEGKKPTTSFGVSIIHYQFPLYFAIEEARKLLLEAKNFKTANGEKNAIAFKTIKSSGESFETILGKNSAAYKNFKLLLNNVFDVNKNEKLSNYLKSIHIKLWNDKAMMDKIGTNKNMLRNYFDNNFNEEVHKTPKIKEYINMIIEFIFSVYSEEPKVENNDDEKEKDYINQIHSCLKFVRFMDEKSELIVKEKGDEK